MASALLRLFWGPSAFSRIKPSLHLLSWLFKHRKHSFELSTSWFLSKAWLRERLFVVGSMHIHLNSEFCHFVLVLGGNAWIHCALSCYWCVHFMKCPVIVFEVIFYHNTQNRFIKQHGAGNIFHIQRPGALCCPWGRTLQPVCHNLLGWSKWNTGPLRTDPLSWGGSRGTSRGEGISLCCYSRGMHTCEFLCLWVKNIGGNIPQDLVLGLQR